MVLQCLKMRPGSILSLVQFLNSANIVGSYDYPSKYNKESLPSSYQRITKDRNCLQGTKLPQSYSFRSIYSRVRTRITPKQIHIHNTRSTQRTKKRPQSFRRRKDNKNVHQPLCIDYPNITAGIRELNAITHIK